MALYSETLSKIEVNEFMVRMGFLKSDNQPLGFKKFNFGFFISAWVPFKRVCECSMGPSGNPKFVDPSKKFLRMMVHVIGMVTCGQFKNTVGIYFAK